MSEESLIDKLMNIDRRIIYGVAFVLFIIPQVVSLGLPFAIHPWTQKVYDLIDDLPDGSYIIYDLDVLPGGFADVAPGTTAVLKHMFSKDFKIVFFSVVYPEGTSFFEVYMDRVNPIGKEYGVDYVYLGFIPGGETASAELAKNLRVGIVDFYGTPLEELPLMQEVNDVNDFALMYVEGFTPPVYYSVRQWASPYDIPMAITGFSVNLPDFLPAYNSGLIDAMINGARGGAEYEKLINQPGSGHKGTDAQSLIHVFALLLITSTNILARFQTKENQR